MASSAHREIIMQKKLLFLQSSIKPNLGFKLVKPEDIMEGEFKEISVKDLVGQHLIPYCIDFNNNILIQSVGLHPFQALKATFHYYYIRKNAKKFLFMPLEFLTKPPPKNISAILLFSPGRCGSTLLSKLIAKIGVTSISEPDIYSQSAIYFATKVKNQAKAAQVLQLLKWANYFLLAPFLKKEPSNILIKLRSHVTYSPGIVLSSFPKPHKTIFIKRNFHSWCKSRMRSFANTIEHNVEIYIQSLHCLHFLLKNTDCLVINYEDINENPELVVKQLSSFFSIDINFDNVKDVLAQDSQADTKLARDKVKKEFTSDELNKIKSIWSERAPRELLKELNIV
jgi:hypothetical protein